MKQPTRKGYCWVLWRHTGNKWAQFGIAYSLREAQATIGNQDPRYGYTATYRKSVTL